MSRLVTDHLPLLAGALNGVKKLRELILELAVRGKLVAQDSGDAAVNSDSEDGWPFLLPSAWRWCSLRDLQPDFQNGASSRGDPDGDSIVVLRLADIKAGEIDLTNVRNLNLNASAVEKYRLNANDILVIRVNGSADLVGRFISCQEDIDAIYCDHFIRLRLPRHLINARYLQIASNSKTIRSRIQDLFVTTAGQKTVNQGHIGSLPIPLPPSAEQNRIIAKVDELMALCDRLETRQSDAQAAHARLVDELLGRLLQARDAEDFAECWGRVKENFDVLFTTEQSVDALKLAVMRIAVSGKLVAQHNCDKPAGTIISELAKHWEQKRNSRKASLSEVPVVEHKHPLPESWVWARFGYVAETRLGKMLDAAKNKGMPKPYLRNTNVQWARFDLSDLKEMRLEQDELQEYSVKAGDLLICEGGEPGRCAIWRESDREIYFQKALHRARPLCGISSDYLQIFLTVDSLSGSLSALFTGATIKHFTGEKLEQYVIALPSIGEQNRIVAKVDELMALCDRVKVKLVRAQALNERLAGTLVERAVL
ncbi:restriction endonuclease subunit S [Sphaerotilus sp.]|uniref:restriction endonuclease subunit S n=1 Tax=Sphaerotilus sp. TaxID=2093942 RepID=UPI0025D9DF16|nr:restriction endonuclease subunit S [Sphaerotilus sp.]